MKTVLLAVALLLLLTGTPGSETRDYWCFTSIVGPDTVSIRARDFNGHEFFQGTWTFYIRGASGFWSLRALNLYEKNTDTLAVDDSLDVVLTMPSESKGISYNDYIVADSIIIFLPLADTLRVTAVGESKDRRDRFGEPYQAY